MSKSVLFGFALVAMLGTACNRDNAEPARAGEGGGLSGAGNPEIRLNAGEEQFVKDAAISNKYEAEMADMAENKAQHDGVKQYAEQLNRDHSNALDDLRRIAGRANVNLDTDPPAEKASTHDRIEALDAKAFDRGYITQMVEDHQKNIAKFEQMQGTATGEVKAFIDKTLPVMREHLQKAEMLMPQVGK